MQIIDDTLKRIRITVGDITTLQVDAIVNAANESLLGGGGVDGAIHRAAGPELRKHNKTLGGCRTGLAVRTPSFFLEEQGIRHIIHTVGPVWRHDRVSPANRLGINEKLGYCEEDVLLASCYMQSLELAVKHDVTTIAFPAISTGAYNFPRHRAARIAIGHVLGFLSNHDQPSKVIFCCFDDGDAAVYRDTIEKRNEWMFNRKRG